MIRAARLLLPVALAASIAAPLAAQEFSDGLTFLRAVRSGDANKVQAILNNPSSGAVNTRDMRTGEAALHILVEQRNGEWLNYFLAHGAQPDIQKNDGSTPLGLAAQVGWVDGARILLSRRAGVDLSNNRGETPLILAVQARHLSSGERLEMVRLLMSQGADPRKQDNIAGYSALDYARQDTRAADLVRVLEQSRQRPAGGEVYGPN